MAENKDREGEQRGTRAQIWGALGCSGAGSWGSGGVLGKWLSLTDQSQQMWLCSFLQGSNKNEHGIVKCWGRDCRPSPDSFLPLLSY